MKTTLLIMAAGIGSRFGTGIKQLEPVDDAGHIIMDYSIHDALEAGFNHVVFIIRKDIEQEFKEVIGERIKAICSAHDVAKSSRLIWNGTGSDEQVLSWRYSNLWDRACFHFGNKK